jgi:predicted small lipoprotein YifL
MKKLLVLMLTLVMMFTLAACGEKSTSASAPAASQSEAGDTGAGAAKNENLVVKSFGYVSISVPNEFSDPENEWDEYYVSEGPNWSTIEVSIGAPVNQRPEEWNKEGMAEQLGDMLKNFKGEFDLNGNKAVYYTIYEQTEGGKGSLRHLVWLYNADISAQYSIALQHSSDDAFFSSDVIDQIINSITLAPEAQHLEGRTEG